MRLLCRFAFITLAVLAVSCSGEKKDILPEKKMEDVLFDYHLAESVSRLKNADSLTSKRYFDLVMEKHGVTRAEFDSSMVYYMKHADKLHDIYVRLSERFDNEARLQGIEGGRLAASYTMEGDTANIWNMNGEYVFTEYVPDNLMKFYIKADTAFKPGDKFTLSFRTNFLYQDGSRNGYAAFSVRFLNDSVVTRAKILSSVGISNFEVRDDKRIGVKEIIGYFAQRQSDNDVERTAAPLRMMVVSDLKLIIMNTAETEGFAAK